MKCPNCNHEWSATKPKPKPVSTSPGSVDTASMGDDELRTYYKRTSHVEDVRFFVNAIRGTSMHAEASVLLVEAEHGLPRVEVFRRLTRLHERWRTQGRPRSNEAAFWRSIRRLSARERGKAYRTERDRVLGHIKDAAKGWRHGPTPTWSGSNTINGMIEQVKREVRDMVRTARTVYPAIAAEAAA